MVKCDYCEYSTENLCNFRRHFKSVHVRAKIYCQHCEEKFSRKDNLNRHTRRKHKDKIQNIMEISIGFDIRLKENFKLFVSKLIENIQSFAKQPPKSIIYAH